MTNRHIDNICSTPAMNEYVCECQLMQTRLRLKLGFSFLCHSALLCAPFPDNKQVSTFRFWPWRAKHQEFTFQGLILIIHTLQFFFLKKTMLYCFHTFTVSLFCPESEIDENFLAVNWGTRISKSWSFWSSSILWNHIFLVGEIRINFSVWTRKGPPTITFATSLP